MRSYFCPDELFLTYQSFTVEFCLKHQVKVLILDIDNTIAPYEQPEPDEKALLWFRALHDIGVTCFFLSNNEKERVELFNHKIGIQYFAKAKKPLLTYAKKITLGHDLSKVWIMGDQIFTDVWCGKRLGIHTALVPPIKDKTNFLTRFKRVLEKPILRYALKRRKMSWN